MGSAQSAETVFSALLIEDSPADAALIQHRIGFPAQPAFKVRHESTLREGIAALQHLDFDIVILDLSLPDSDGIETFRKIAEVASRTPIVVLTGITDEWLALEAVRKGAQDFVSKGDIIAESLGRSLQFSIERYQRELADQESEPNGRKSDWLVPDDLPLIEQLDVAGRCDCAASRGCDFIDYFLADDQHVIVLIGCASGNEMASAIVTAQTRAAIRVSAAMTNDAATMIQQANQLLCEQRGIGQATLFLCRIDPRRGKCSHVSADHTAEVFRRDGTLKVLPVGGPALGVVPDETYEAHELQLEATDTLVMFSAGVMARAAEPSDKFGVSRIRDTMRTTHNLTARQSVERLFERANSYAHDTPPKADMAAVVVKILATENGM